MHPRVRSLLPILAVAATGCGSLVAVTSEPGRCSEEEITGVYGGSGLYGHTPVLEGDYTGQLCDWDGAALRSHARMARIISHYEIGRAWVRHGDPARARAAFVRDLEGATTPWAHAQDRIELAKLASEAGDHAEALAQLEAGEEELGRRSWRLDEPRVEILLAAGRRRDAIAVLEGRIEFENENWVAVTNLVQIGDLWLEEGQAREARLAYEAALAREGYRQQVDVFDARLGLARAWALEGDLEPALRSLGELLETNRDRIDEDKLAEGWRLRAEVAAELGRPWNAAASERRAFEIEHRYREPSELARAHLSNRLAHFYLEAERYELAFSSYRDAYRTFARELGPTHRHTIISAHNVGVASLSLGDPYEALPWLRLAAELHQRAPSEAYDRGLTLLNLARAEARIGARVEAGSHFLAAIELLGDLEHEDLDQQDRARMFQDAARVFLDLYDCGPALAAVERAHELYARAGEAVELNELVGEERLRHCQSEGR